MAGPAVRPMIVCMNNRTDVATERIRTVATDCATANEGPKNIEASMTMTENIGTTTAMFGER